MTNLFLVEVVLDLTQNSDSNDEPHAMQELKVKVMTAGAGPYLVIETARWAMDQPQELNALLVQVRDRLFPLFEAINGGEAETAGEPESAP